jgi:hypothetical protein
VSNDIERPAQGVAKLPLTLLSSQAERRLMSRSRAVVCFVMHC